MHKEEHNFTIIQQYQVFSVDLESYSIGNFGLETGYGLLKCHWQKTNDGLRMIVLIPPNTSATIKVPVKGYNNPTILENEQTMFNAGGAASPLPAGIEFVEAGTEEVVFQAAAGNYLITVYDNQ